MSNGNRGSKSKEINMKLNQIFNELKNLEERESAELSESRRNMSELDNTSRIGSDDVAWSISYNTSDNASRINPDNTSRIGSDDVAWSISYNTSDNASRINPDDVAVRDLNSRLNQISKELEVLKRK